MARRPDVFDRTAFERALHEQGCPAQYCEAYAGDFKLFVPLLFRALGREKVLELVNDARLELGLKERDTYWSEAARYFVGWATDAIAAYKGSKGLIGDGD
jgi:hypothetical protein